MPVHTAAVADTLALARGSVRVEIARRPFAIDIRRDGRRLIRGFGLWCADGAATPGKVCVAEPLPLFNVSQQPTLSHHLKKVRGAGIVGAERPGLWAYYYVHEQALNELSAWLS